MEIDKERTTSNSSNKPAYLRIIGVLFFLIGLFLTLAIAVFYLFQSNNPPSHTDFATVILAVEIQIIGIGLIVSKRK